MQPSQRLIKEPGGPGSLGPLSYCHWGWAAKVVRAGSGVGAGLAGGGDSQASPAAAGERAAVGEESHLGSSGSSYVPPVVLGTRPSLTWSSPGSYSQRWVLPLPFFRGGKRRHQGVQRVAQVTTVAFKPRTLGLDPLTTSVFPSGGWGEIDGVHLELTIWGE